MKFKWVCVKCKKGYLVFCLLIVDMLKDLSLFNGIFFFWEFRKFFVLRGRDFVFGEGFYMYVEYSDIEMW